MKMPSKKFIGTGSNNNLSNNTWENDLGPAE